MGGGRWNSSDWTAYANSNVRGRSREELFASRGMKSIYDPARITVRESRDSLDNPQSTAIIVASDVTGSMGLIAHNLMAEGLNTLATEIYARKPVSDPHVMTMAVGDAFTDEAPLQVTQFEADIRVAEQTKDLWLEGGGGGNGGESYSAAHLFAATKTSIDCFEKRGAKGYLFTVGDEPIHDGMTREQIGRTLGLRTERDMSAAEILAMAQRSYEVFHVVIREGYATQRLDQVLSTWRPLLGERVLVLDDHRRLAELVVSAIQIANGASVGAVAASWGGETASVVAGAFAAAAPQPKRFGFFNF